MFELKHVPLHKSFPDFLVGPGDEKFVIMICFLCQARGKVNWSLQVHPFPAKEVTCEGQSKSWISLKLGNLLRGFFGCISLISILMLHPHAGFSALLLTTDKFLPFSTFTRHKGSQKIRWDMPRLHSPKSF